ncbi:hypothetical protein HKX48_003509 [Thoreauomyces humboldtii]|nr:hypothetical protein HKX48_003509 [Thoreauomyces humboldtii]
MQSLHSTTSSDDTLDTLDTASTLDSAFTAESSEYSFTTVDSADHLDNRLSVASSARSTDNLLEQPSTTKESSDTKEAPPANWAYPETSPEYFYREEAPPYSPPETDVENPNRWSAAEPRHRKRRCGGRLTRCQYVMVIVAGVIIGLMAILLPIVKFVVIPHAIKTKFKTGNFGGQGNMLQEVSWDDVNLKNLTDSGLHVKLAAGVSNTQLPITFAYAGIEPTTFHFSDAASGQTLFQVRLSNGIYVNGTSDLYVLQHTLGVNFPNLTQAQDTLNLIIAAAHSNDTHIPIPMTIKITATASVNIMGIIFADLDLERNQTVDVLSFAWTVRKLISAPPHHGGNFTHPAWNGNGTQAGHSGRPPVSNAFNVTLSRRDGDGFHGPPPGPTGLAASITLSGLEVDVTDSRVSTSVTGSFVMDQPLTVAIGEITFTTVVNAQPLAAVTISGLSVRRADSTFAAKVALNPLEQGDTSVLRTVIGQVVGGNSTDGCTVGVRNVTFRDTDGNPVAWLNTVLSPISLDASLDVFRAKLAAIASIGASPSTQLQVQSVAVEMKPDNVVSVTPVLLAKLPFDARIDITQVSGQIRAGGKGAVASFLMAPAQVNGTGEQTVTLPLQFRFATSAEAQASVARIANQLVSRPMAMIHLSQFQIGGREGQQSELNALASLISVPVPIHSHMLLSTLNTSLATGSVTEAAISRLDVKLQETSFNIQAGAQFLQPFPVNLVLPYVSLGLGVDDQDLLTASLSGLSLWKDTKDVNVTASGTLANDPAVGAKLQSVIAQFNGTAEDGSALVLRGISFGVGPNDSIKLFDALNLTLPTETLQDFFAAARKRTAAISLSLANMQDVSLANIIPAITTASLSATAKGLALSAQGNVTNPLAISADAPLFGVDVLGPNARIMSLSVNGVKLKPGFNNVSLAIQGAFASGNSAAKDAAALAQAFMSGTIAPGSVSLSGLTFGGDNGTANSVFSCLRVPAPLSLLSIANTANSQGQSNGGQGSTVSIDSVGGKLATPSLGSMLFSTGVSASTQIRTLIQPVPSSLLTNLTTPGTIAVSPLQITNLLPGIGLGVLNVSVPFASMDITVDGVNTTSISISGLNGGGGGAGLNAIDLVLSATFGTSPALPSDVKALVDSITSGTSDAQKISVSNLRFGLSKATSVKALSKVVVVVPLNPTSPSAVPSDTANAQDSS